MLRSKPTSGIASCCARATSGHATAAPRAALRSPVASCRAWAPSQVPPPILPARTARRRRFAACRACRGKVSRSLGQS
jgi:hypothetical protein